MEQNWLVTRGFAEVKKNELIYIPTRKLNDQGQEIILNAALSSNIEFENGIIEFDVKMADVYGICQLVLNTDSGADLNVGLNTVSKLYGITKYNYKTGQWELLNGQGEPQTFEINKTYKVKIIVTGSIISLYVNGIFIVAASENIRNGQLQFALYGATEIKVSNIKVKPSKAKAFVVMQFTEAYNQLYLEVIKPVCEKFGLEVERADEFYTSTPIIKDIEKSIRNASVIIAEITPDNPNVFYEVGFAHAIEKPTILLSDRTREKLPFDISGFRTLFYENSIGGKTKVEKNLIKFLENIF